MENNLIALTDLGILEVNDYSSKYNVDESHIKETIKVLTLLKNEILNNNDKINGRVLRAMHDVGMSSYKEFENTPLENIINDITSILYNEIPEYKFLEPLRNEFGKGDPI